ncbi:NTCP2-like protein [Mya arenaria]|uniref:NTCP2-like protein n=1 Tax=Mya arenaria TaxID=6604 RepID=A0ABY7E3X9_MYAAR|nr:ileal sodium/bile acid cotransporter-like [Mya arenaria]WAR03211.1 NTCP2-like protein [Mya arenaria]
MSSHDFRRSVILEDTSRMNATSTATTPHPSNNAEGPLADSTMTKLQVIMDALLITLTVLLMLSFGCSLHIKHIKDHFSRPIGVVLGVLLHFIVLPYMFYALDQVMMLDRYDEMSLTVLATCPAGGVSNLYVYYADGDLALGVIVTAASTVLGLAFMPLNMWLFSRAWDGGPVLPYIQTFISLVTILVPVATGMIVLRFSQSAAKWVSILGSITATVMIVGTVGLSSYMYPQMYLSSWKTWFIAAAFAPLAFITGYLLSLLMRLPADTRRTMGITTSAKSMALCLTIIAVSFQSSDYIRYLVFPELHSIILMVELALYCLGYRFYRWCNGKYVMSSELPTDVSALDTQLSSSDCEEPTQITTIEDLNVTINRRMSDSHALAASYPPIVTSEYKSELRMNL